MKPDRRLELHETETRRWWIVREGGVVVATFRFLDVADAVVAARYAGSL